MKKFILILGLILIGNIAICSDFGTYTLKNGQTVIIKEVHTNPIVTIDTWVKTGSINENDCNNGVSHFLEHLFFKGTQKHPTGEFDRILESKGAINNAATSKDFTHYYITIPSKDFDLALEMHADMLQNPALPPNELEKERKVVIEEISKDINSPNQKLYNNLVDMLYTQHPYKRKVIGTEEIVKNIPREKIFEYFHTYYAPSNMVTVIAGDIDTKTALEKLKTNFGTEYKRTPKHNYYKEKPLTSQLKKIDSAQTDSGYILIGFRTVTAKDKDIYALDVLSTILGDGRSSILYRNLKENKQLAFSISASNSTYKDDGLFLISANFIPKNYKELEEEIFEEIEELIEDGITEEQLNRAKSIIERDTYYARESVSNIAEEIGYSMIITEDKNFYKNYLNNIQKVTKADVDKVAKKYLDKNKSAISVILPKENLFEREISYKKKTQTDNIKPVNFNTHTQKYELENGSTLLLTPNSANDIIAITIFAKGGEFIENVAGTAKLTAATMLKDTKNYTATELANELEDYGIKITTNSRADAFEISALTTKSEYDRTIKLLNEVVNNAVFNQNEIEKVKKEKINTIKKNRDRAISRAIEEYNSLIYKGSVYSNTSKILENTYPKITRNDIVTYYNKIFTPNNLVISVNGNTDNDKIIYDMTKIFNKEKYKNFNYKNYSIPHSKAPRTSTITDKTTQTDWIFLGWQTDGISNPKDYATLSVMDSLLGSGMSSRLFRNLREKEGLAYQLGSSFSANMLKGSFTVYIGTNPATLEHSKTKLFEEINRLKTEKVSSTELQEAKDKLLGHYILSQETNMEKASTVGWFETSGRGYDFGNCYEKLINSVTADDIQSVAKKYFNNNFTLSVVKK